MIKKYSIQIGEMMRNDEDKSINKVQKSDNVKQDSELSPFDIDIISIMTHLYQKEAVEDNVMEVLRELNVLYHTLLDKNGILEEKVNIDWKTNLLKYRDDYLTLIIKSASRIIDMIPTESYNISYIRFDLDDFSVLNNRYGHHCGDEVLVDMANILKSNSRPTDYLIRFGGEEFDVMLPSTDLKGATAYLDKIYTSMKKMTYNFADEKVTVTASAGLAIFRMPFSELQRINNDQMKKKYLLLQKCADNALYDAKLSGKNQYKLYNDKINYLKIRKQYSQKAKR